MIIYYVILMFTLLLGLPIYKNKDYKLKILYLFCVFLMLFVVMAIRGDAVGTDIYIYDNKFNLISDSKDWNMIINIVPNAPVYCILNKIVSFFGGYRLYLVVTAAIILSSVAIYIYFFSKNVVFSVYSFMALFFYLHSFNISRQFMAIAFVLYALCFKKNNKFASSIFCFVLAIGIHSTSMFALPLILLNPNKISTKIFIILLSASNIVVVFLKVFFTPLINIFSLIFPRYQVYLNGGAFSVYNRSSGAVVFLGLFYLGIALFAIVLQTNLVSGIRMEDKERSQLRFLIFGVVMGGVIGIVGGSLEAMARVLYFYQIHAICLIPNIIDHFKRNKYCLLIYYSMILILLIPFTICLTRNFGEVVPYYTFWQ